LIWWRGISGLGGESPISPDFSYSRANRCRDHDYFFQADALSVGDRNLALGHECLAARSTHTFATNANVWGTRRASGFSEIIWATRHSLNRALRRSGPVWQEESFDHVLRSDESFDQKVEYIRQNPVRRGLVTRPEDYRWLWVE
jgi:hypothetical protein